MAGGAIAVPMKPGRFMERPKVLVLPLRCQSTGSSRACPLLAHSGHSNRARICPLSDNSGQRWILARDDLSANDPKRTTAQLNMSQPRRGGDNTIRHGKMEQIGPVAVVFTKSDVIAYE